MSHSKSNIVRYMILDGTLGNLNFAPSLTFDPLQVLSTTSNDQSNQVSRDTHLLLNRMLVAHGGCIVGDLGSKAWAVDRG